MIIKQQIAKKLLHRMNGRVIVLCRIKKIGSCELRIRGIENENNNYIY